MELFDLLVDVGDFDFLEGKLPKLMVGVEGGESDGLVAGNIQDSLPFLLES